jgi:hypothetical protein
MVMVVTTMTDTNNEVTHDFTNFEVFYSAPTEPGQSFEPRCWIMADSALHGPCRVFDVPDPDESQRAVAEAACKALNSHGALVAALEGLITRFEQTGEAWMSDPAWIAAREALHHARS